MQLLGMGRITVKRLLEAVSLTVALLIASAANCQSNLDKPISTKPTVRSEIARGHDAAFECNGVGKIGRFRLIEACVSKVMQDNIQQQKASTAFRLGIYLVALAQWEAIGPNKLHPEDNMPSAVDGGVNVWRSEVKKSQAALKLTEKDICSAITMKCEALHNSLVAIN
jgi:hypothetical protein